jgi:hypothetical protein
MPRANRTSLPGSGLCRTCLANLFYHGRRGSPYCNRCALVMYRNPGVDITLLRNRRSERLPQERPVADRWRFYSDGPLCAGADPEQFEYRVTSQGIPPKEARDAARTYCASCPVFAQCHAEAETHQYRGLWAGVWRRPTSATNLLDAAAEGVA